MKKEIKKGVVLTLFLAVFLFQYASADIIFNEPVKAVYNFGESIYMPATIKTVNDFSGVFQMDLICNGTAINFYKNGVQLASGEEKTIESSLVLIQNIIGREEGSCRVKAILGSEYVLSSEFKISSLLTVETELEKTEFDPKESILLKGKVMREAGETSNGFVEARIISNSRNISQQETIANGNFEMGLTLPSDLEAGNYVILVTAVEKDSGGEITNKGVAEKNIVVRQVPANLELMLENTSVMPGAVAEFTAILHDQTGQPIRSMVIVTIKDSNNKIVEQKEIQTNEPFRYTVKSGQAPAAWKVFAVSNKLTAEAFFKIEEKEEIGIEIVNKTITIKNTGNIFYDKTILVKVDDTPVNLEVKLKIGESKKYVVNAPDGDYDVTIFNGFDELIKRVSLTGRTIEIKEAGISSLAVFGWFFLIAILVVAFIFVFRKTYQKPFSLRMLLGLDSPKKKSFKELSFENNTLTAKAGSRAELSLSIKGEKQDASIVCIKIKDLREVKSKRGSASETIEKIISLAEENKGAIYENQDYLFVLFAPVRTKTFRNEKLALDMADRMQNILAEHNRAFNQKITFGISLNSGAIIAKVEPDSFKFMSMGTLITSAKKIASLSGGELLLGKEMNDLLRLVTKTEKEMRDGTPVYVIKSVKKENEEAKKFIDKFMNRQK